MGEFVYNLGEGEISLIWLKIKMQKSKKVNTFGFTEMFKKSFCMIKLETTIWNI